MRFGAQLWSQQTTWPQFRDAALRAEGAGWDSVWTWDHLLAIFGPWEQPILEGWSTLAATAAVTDKVRLGLMVGANTFRNPGLTAKLATTLDHVSGAGPSSASAAPGSSGSTTRSGSRRGGSGFGERLDRLDEAVVLLRRLLDGERSPRGPLLPIDDALCEPRPIQAHLPILIGGSGPQKTLRTTARYADAWNTGGTSTRSAKASTSSAGTAPTSAAIRRDRADRELPDLIRDTAAGAEVAYAELLAANGTDTLDVPTLLGDPELVADGLAPLAEMGFTTTFARLPGPYDLETIDRMHEERRSRRFGDAAVFSTDGLKRHPTSRARRRHLPRRARRAPPGRAAPSARGRRRHEMPRSPRARRRAHWHRPPLRTRCTRARS